VNQQGTGTPRFACISLHFSRYTLTCGPAYALHAPFSSSLNEGSPSLPKHHYAPAGVGPGNGAAFARRFAAEGYAVALLARTTGLTNKLTNELPVARAYACDVGDPADDMVAQRSVTASLFAVAA
jgi:hypothetical protein